MSEFPAHDGRQSDTIEAGDRLDRALLMAWLAGGDTAGLDKFFDKHMERCWRVARRWTSSDADADDALQAACLKVTAYLQEKPLPDRPGAWFRLVVINACRMFHREHTRRQQRERLVAQAQPQAVIEEDGIDKEGLHLALGDLPAGLQEVLRLHYDESLSTSVIAKRLHIAERTVRHRLSQARGRLRAICRRRRIGVAVLALLGLRGQESTLAASATQVAVAPAGAGLVLAAAMIMPLALDEPIRAVLPVYDEPVSQAAVVVPAQHRHAVPSFLQTPINMDLSHVSVEEAWSQLAASLTLSYVQFPLQDLDSWAGVDLQVQQRPWHACADELAELTGTRWHWQDGLLSIYVDAVPEVPARSQIDAREDNGAFAALRNPRVLPGLIAATASEDPAIADQALAALLSFEPQLPAPGPRKSLFHGLAEHPLVAPHLPRLRQQLVHRPDLLAVLAGCGDVAAWPDIAALLDGQWPWPLAMHVSRRGVQARYGNGSDRRTAIWQALMCLDAERTRRLMLTQLNARGVVSRQLPLLQCLPLDAETVALMQPYMRRAPAPVLRAQAQVSRIKGLPAETLLERSHGRHSSLLLWTLVERADAAAVAVLCSVERWPRGSHGKLADWPQGAASEAWELACLQGQVSPLLLPVAVRAEAPTALAMAWQELARTSSASTAHALVAALLSARVDHRTAVLRRLLRDPQQAAHVRQAIASQLLKGRCSGDVGVLQELSQRQDDPGLALAALKGLGHGPAAVWDDLLAASYDPDPQRRLAALEGIAVGDHGGQQRLLDAWSDPDLDVRRTAVILRMQGLDQSDHSEIKELSVALAHRFEVETDMRLKTAVRSMLGVVRQLLKQSR